MKSEKITCEMLENLANSFYKEQSLILESLTDEEVLHDPSYLFSFEHDTLIKERAFSQLIHGVNSFLMLNIYSNRYSIKKSNNSGENIFLIDNPFKKGTLKKEEYNEKLKLGAKRYIADELIVSLLDKIVSENRFTYLSVVQNIRMCYYDLISRMTFSKPQDYSNLINGAHQEQFIKGLQTVVENRYFFNESKQMYLDMINNSVKKISDSSFICNYFKSNRLDDNFSKKKTETKPSEFLQAA